MDKMTYLQISFVMVSTGVMPYRGAQEKAISVRCGISRAEPYLSEFGKSEFSQNFTAWKLSTYGVFSGRYLDTFHAVLHEGVKLCISRISKLYSASYHVKFYLFEVSHIKVTLHSDFRENYYQGVKTLLTHDQKISYLKISMIALLRLYKVYVMFFIP